MKTVHNLLSIILLVGTLAISLAIPSGALADFAIATVDVNRVLNESKEAQAKRKVLDGMASAARKKVDDRRSTLQALEKKLKESGVKEDSKDFESFRVQARDFNRLVKDSEEELRKEFMKTNRELTERTMKLVKDFAQLKKFDMVLDKGDAGKGPILYTSISNDITDAIIAQING